MTIDTLELSRGWLMRGLRSVRGAGVALSLVSTAIEAQAGRGARDSSVAPVTAAEPSAVIVLRGANVHTALGPAIAGATIVMRDGRIAAVGLNVPIPPDARVIDVSGKQIIPGMIDNHSHIGFDLSDANDVARFAPRNRIVDVLSQEDIYWDDAIAGGVTTVVTGPGSGPVRSGQAAVVKTWGPNFTQRVLLAEGGLKIGMGRKSPSQTPSTTMAVTAFLRAQFIRAQEYMEAWRRYEASAPSSIPPARDEDLEVLARVLRRETPLRAHVLAAQDIISLLRLKKEFNFNMSLHHALEAHKVADEIAEAGVGVVGMPLSLRIGVSEEVLEGTAELVAKGVLFAFHTDARVIATSQQRFNGAIAIRYGMSELDALKALTLNGARIAGVAERVGSLEVGKDADLVVLDGDWYELKTRVDMVFVNGVLAYDRAAKELP